MASFSCPELMCLCVGRAGGVKGLQLMLNPFLNFNIFYHEIGMEFYNGNVKYIYYIYSHKLNIPE